MVFQHTFRAAKQPCTDVNNGWFTWLQQELARDGYTLIGVANSCWEFVKYMEQADGSKRPVTIQVQEFNDQYAMLLEGETDSIEKDLPLIMTGMYLEDKSRALHSLMQANLLVLHKRAQGRKKAIGVAIVVAGVVLVIAFKNREKIAELMSKGAAELKEGSESLAEAAKQVSELAANPEAVAAVGGQLAESTAKQTAVQAIEKVSTEVAATAANSGVAGQATEVVQQATELLTAASRVSEGASQIFSKAGQLTPDALALAGAATGIVVARNVIWKATALNFNTTTTPNGERNVVYVILNKSFEQFTKEMVGKQHSSQIVPRTGLTYQVMVALSRTGEVLLKYIPDGGEDPGVICMKVFEPHSSGVSRVEFWTQSVDNKETAFVPSVREVDHLVAGKALNPMLEIVDDFIEEQVRPTKFANMYFQAAKDRPDIIRNLRVVAADSPEVDNDPYASDKDVRVEDLAQ